MLDKSTLLRIYINMYLILEVRNLKNKGFHTVRGYQLLNQDTWMTSAMEDYLEMIYRTSLTCDHIRTNKLAELLNVKDSSVTKMVQTLGRAGFIEYRKYGIITLTDTGREVGKFLLERHKTIEALLKILGNGDDLLSQTELIEHCVSEETLENISILVSFFENNKAALNSYREYKRDYK